MEVDQADEGDEGEDWGECISERLGKIHGALMDINKTLSGLTVVAGRLLSYVTDLEERRLAREEKRGGQDEEGEKVSIFMVEELGLPGASTSGSAPSTKFVTTP